MRFLRLVVAVLQAASALSALELLSGECGSISYDEPHPGHYTCQPADNAKGIQITLRANDSSISFGCGKKTDTELKPVEKENQFYQTEQCDQPTDLDTVCVGTTLSKNPDTEEHPYKLTMGDGKREAKTIYYSCEPKVGGNAEPSGENALARSPPKVNKCIVKIIIEPKADEDTGSNQNDDSQGNGEAMKVTQCKVETVEATASSESPLAFKCDPEVSLLPAQHEKVFDGRNGECDEEVPLTSLVDAELQPPKEAEKENGVYTLKINKDPEHDTTVCYKCVASDGKESPAKPSKRSDAQHKTQCLLKVSVKGTSGAASSADSMFVRSVTFMASLVVFIFFKAS
ncbi:hypothetical protein BESB_033890 [Besnoitia besnoiti]|uniref:SAG-related sequence n=1 Tax=Besnoitia besnoiti TaxID=94643 RepID=A0A2A9MKV7_BESBE|nr:hypothetical protein BESB_033890 [Besnoitia besnoiti]PFH36931.1 hypothetical protein BESB_033890 [Besnoitia besnoiti]